MAEYKSLFEPGKTVKVTTHQEIPLIWKISAAWATKRHNRTVAGIMSRCHAACCYGPTFWPGRVGNTSESKACQRLGPKGCTFAPEDKPLSCHLYPLRLNSSGTLILHQRAIYAKGICKGNFGDNDGPLLIDALKDNLTTLFGKKQYEQARKDVMAGHDGSFTPSPELMRQYYREQEWEEANLPPQPRSHG